MLQVGTQEFARRFGVGHDPLSAPFGDLGSDTHHAVSWVKISALQGTEFFTPESGIVGQSHHAACPKRRMSDNF